VSRNRARRACRRCRKAPPTWTEEQSRQNFTAWQRVVVPGNPMSSRLLLHPLAKEAGGDHFHGGGKHWESQNDPDFQTIAAWIKGATLSSPPSVTIDTRAKIEVI
jgi:hypothetical protein